MIYDRILRKKIRNIVGWIILKKKIRNIVGWVILKKKIRNSWLDRIRIIRYPKVEEKKGKLIFPYDEK